MKETNDLVGIFTNAETFIAFVVFIIPGFLSLRAYEAVRGGDGRKINESLVDVVAYSFVTDLLALPTLILEQQHITDAFWRPASMSLTIVIGFIVVPIGLGIGWYHLQRWLAAGNLVRDPTAKPWDKMFQRILDENLKVGVIVTLPDGRRLGGRWKDPGFSSHYPAAEQLHIGESWVLDNVGRFKQPVAGSMGFIIDKADILTVEFYDWNVIAKSFASEGDQNNA